LNVDERIFYVLDEAAISQLLEIRRRSKAARKELATRLSAERIYEFHEKGRPTKRVRRQIIRFKKARVE
jgi:ribosome-associated heat shock protein Hsp15